MSGGISAIKGFSYQAKVILDLLLPFFDKHGGSGFVRPEGIEDLDFYWREDGFDHRKYIQIKKPREDIDGTRTLKSWSLAIAINGLLPNAVKNLTGNYYHLSWVLGDEVTAELQTLIDAGVNAYTEQPKTYLYTLHRLALDQVLNTHKLKKEEVKKQLNKFRVNQQLTVADIKVAFSEHLNEVEVPSALYANYQNALDEVHAILPCILSRITIDSTYGLEGEVEARVQANLQEKYNLTPEIINKTVSRNLTGFIEEISKQPNRQFNLEEFEDELRCVWPTMVPVRLPPTKEEYHITRPDLVENITSSEAVNTIEVVGGSGTGKTMLAAEIFEFQDITSYQGEFLYIEVRDDISFRDVISGVAFHLRRMGHPEAFKVAIDYEISVMDFVKKMAKTLSIINTETTIIIDFVDGSCTPSFSNELSHFIRSKSGESLKFVMLSQESVLSNMSEFDLDRYKVKRLNLRGFYFKEFKQLVSNYHTITDSDYSVLSDIYDRATAGRSTGLYAQLAHSFASFDSLKGMSKASQMSPEEMLPDIEQQRFSRLTPDVKDAAERLVCLFLPFQREEVIDLFPNEKIGLAIRELKALGMLRTRPDGLYEMHETIRAGLEKSIALAFRRETHNVLARWYEHQENHSANIFHLDQAGLSDQAHLNAKNIFCQGKQWMELSPYVFKHKLVTQEELIAVFSNQEKIQHVYLLPGLIVQLQGAVSAEDFFKLLRRYPKRFAESYSDASVCIEAIVTLEPEKLVDLILYGIRHLSVTEEKQAFIDFISTSIRGQSVEITPEILRVFDRESTEIKERLLSVLLLRSSREHFERLFKVISDPRYKRKNENDRYYRTWFFKLNETKEVIEFLAAIPQEDPGKMVIHKSALLGDLEEIVWAERKFLKSACRTVLTPKVTVEEVVKINAIRVLVYLAEPSVTSLCESFIEEKSQLSAMAIVLPALLPETSNPSLYKQQLLDCTLGLDERVNALSMLIMIGENLPAVYQNLKKTPSFEKHQEVWDFFFMMSFSQKPFSEGIPLVKAALIKSQTDDKRKMLLAPMFIKLGDLSCDESTDLLVIALRDNDPQFRYVAGAALGKKRAHRAIPYLIEAYKDEQEEQVAVSMATAIVSSGAQDASSLCHPNLSSIPIKLWQFILAMRSRDVSASRGIVDIARDSEQNWQIRHIAILAAGRLPFDVALGKIFEQVLLERSSLEIDLSLNLIWHAQISSLLLEEAKGIARIFASGKDYFVSFWSEIFDNLLRKQVSTFGSPTSTETARWLFDRLEHHHFPVNLLAVDQIISELHIPILHGATIRSLRLHGQMGIIEKYIVKAHHEWFSAKCIKEIMQLEQPSKQLAERFKELVQQSLFRESHYLERIIDDFCYQGDFVRAKKVLTPAKKSPVEAKETISILSYSEIISLLQTKEATLPGKFVFDELTKEQFVNLSKLLNPENEQSQWKQSFIPKVRFTAGHTLASQEVSTSISRNRNHIFSPLRAALAVPQRVDFLVPWHEKLLKQDYASQYINDVISALALRSDPDLFYRELDQYSDVLIPVICQKVWDSPILKYIDNRFIPYFNRYVVAGDDALFEGLCTLALQVTTSNIDPILLRLLQRWSERIGPKEGIGTGEINLSRGFKRLTEHPRFGLIDGWENLLDSALGKNIRWFEKQDILRFLETEPQSYITVESKLFKNAEFAHTRESEIDRLDRSAEKLFHMTKH